jgi:hypothetical protein
MSRTTKYVSGTNIRGGENMGKRMIIGVIGVMLLVAGCASKTTIRYAMTDIQPAKTSASRSNARVAVLKFTDIRQDSEKMGHGHGLFTDVSSDVSFEDDAINAGVSDTIACHLNESLVFGSVVYLDHDCADLSPDTLAQLRDKGFQGLLAGKIKRFQGVAHASVFDKIAMPFVALAPVTAAISITISLSVDHEHEGYVAFEDVKLIDTATGSVVWSGNIEKKSQYQFNANPAKAAQLALREAISDMVAQLESVKFLETTGDTKGKSRDEGQQETWGEARDILNF